MSPTAPASLSLPLHQPFADQRPPQRVHERRERPDVVRQFLGLVPQSLDLGLGWRIGKPLPTSALGNACVSVDNARTSSVSSSACLGESSAPKSPPKPNRRPMNSMNAPISLLKPEEEIYQRIAKYFTSISFTFIGRPDEDQPIPGISLRDRAMATAAASVVFGLIGGLSSGMVDDSSESELRSALKRFSRFGGLTAVSLKSGAVRIVLVLPADETSDEALIGTFSLLHDELTDFRRFALTTLRNWLFGDVKQGVLLHCLLVFHTQYKADHFANSLSDKCKHITFWKKIWTLPWAIDVPGNRVVRWNGFPPYDDIGLKAMSNHLFRR